jgi:hypothetical protein
MADSADNPVASLLERAAKGMREKAEAATPWPWEATGADVVSRAADRHWAGACAANAEGADGEHIASWHPGVALAVTAWLEREARRARDSMSLEPPFWWCAWCASGWTTDGCECWDMAMALARAWLGETGEGA